MSSPHPVIVFNLGTSRFLTLRIHTLVFFFFSHGATPFPPIVLASVSKTLWCFKAASLHKIELLPFASCHPVLSAWLLQFPFRRSFSFAVPPFVPILHGTPTQDDTPRHDNLRRLLFPQILSGSPPYDAFKRRWILVSFFPQVPSQHFHPSILRHLWVGPPAAMVLHRLDPRKKDV